MKTATVCLNSSDFPISTTLSCAENESIAFVGAILGFQNSTEESCRPGEDRCRTQPDADHLNCIQALCHGRQNCTVAAADSAPADDTCSSFVYMYENITYYCADTKPTAPGKTIHVNGTANDYNQAVYRWTCQARQVPLSIGDHVYTDRHFLAPKLNMLDNPHIFELLSIDLSF